MTENKDIKFDTGQMTEEEIGLLLDALPVDITFIGRNDEVKYFNKLETRIFKRPVSVIGKNIRNCHPEKSLDKVEKIIDSFKNKSRDVAEFWIHLDEKFVYIRYFPMYDKTGKYYGCLEVSQDIASIKKIEGEKRLL